MKILVATDGSDFSKAAIDILANIVAKPKDTSLKIISAVEYQMAMPHHEIAAEHFSQLEQLGYKHAEKLVEQAEMQVRSLFPGGLLDLSTEVITGSPQRVIVEIAHEWDAELIVVGSHGYGFWSRVLLGSVSNSVVHHAPCSVLVVRTAAAETQGK